MYTNLNIDVISQIINYCSIKDLIRLRTTNKENVEMVKYYNGYTMVQIKGSLKYWKKSFPNMKTANIDRRTDIKNEDFQYLENVEVISMILCKQQSITCHTFQYLKNIKDLDLQGCCGHWYGGHHFTDKMFDHLLNLEKFYIDDNHIITDNGIKRLKKIKDLTIHNCGKITNEGIYELTTLTRLDLYNIQITDDVFKDLTNLRELNITFGHHITDKGILYLSNIQKLNFMSCKEIRCINFDRLPKLYDLSLCHMTIYNNDFIFFKNIKSLSIYSGNIDGSGLKYLSNIEVLSIYENPLVDEYLTDLFKFNKIRQINIYRCRTVSGNKKKELKERFGDKLNTDN
jgi:Leucine-rich repeat (LRR) protein